jgi:hypothetical protein
MKLGPVALLAFLDGLEHQGEVVLALEVLLGRKAVVAGAAIVAGQAFTEIVEQEFAAAHAGLGVAHGVGQQLFADLLFGHGLALEELLQLLDVLVAVEGDAFAFAAIAPAATGFLVVALQALGDVVVDHEAHIGLVDAHAEGDGGHDHVHVLHQEAVLVAGALRGVHAGMVGQGLDAVHHEGLGDLLHLFAAEAIDDAAAAPVLFHEADDLAGHVLLGAHLVMQVGAVESWP